MPPDRCSELNMALQSSSSTAGGGTRLYQQMALAREMGFTDSDILRAFNKGVIGQKFMPFPSNSAMVDALTPSAASAQIGGNPWSVNSRRLPSNPIFLSSSASNSSRGPIGLAGAMGIGRSHSLNEPISSSRNGPTNAVQRLIDTFEMEDGRHYEQCQHLKCKLDLSARKEREQKEQLKLAQKRIIELENELKIFTRMKEVKKGEKVDDAEGKNKRINDKMDKEMIGKNLKEVMGMEGTSMGTGNGNDEGMAKELENLKREIQLKNEMIESMIGPQLEFEQLGRELDEAKQQCRELIQAQLCGVCMSGKREVLFMPCLHFTCCKQCSLNMPTCSICRLRIMGKIELFQ